MDKLTIFEGLIWIFISLAILAVVIEKLRELRAKRALLEKCIGSVKNEKVEITYQYKVEE